MCGLLYAHVKRTECAERLAGELDRAVQLMKYRGPDHTGLARHGNHFFAHVRLSIIDVSDASNQPLQNDRSVLLFNGEIYNYKELEPESNSDTHTLLRRIESRDDHGDALGIEGMYAFVHFDKRTGLTTAQRDFFGEKPLYRYEDDEVLIVSSTIKPIVHLLSSVFKKSLSLDRDAIEDYLLFGFVREPKSIYSGIDQIRAGHQVTFGPDSRGPNSQGREAAYGLPDSGQDDYERYLANSIRSTDVCPTLLLSSGIDSTFLLSQIAAEDLTSRICIYKSSKATSDESGAAIRNLAKVLPDCEPLIVQNECSDLELYDRQIAMMEQPSSHGMQIVNILLGIKRAAPNTKLILTGLGGDELYGGYNSFRHLRRYLMLRRYSGRFVPQRFRRFFEIKLTDEFQHVVPAYYFKYRINVDALEFLPDFDLQRHFQEFVHDLNLGRFETTRPLLQLKLCESFDYMKNQLLRDGDNISMYQGMESRSPLLYPASIFNRDRGRRLFRRRLANRHGIRFSRKRGFTLGENKHELARHFKPRIEALNQELHLFPQPLIETISASAQRFELLKRLYVLLAWVRHQTDQRGSSATPESGGSTTIARKLSLTSTSENR